MKHFNLVLKQDLPRTTTRQSYKAISRWLRVSARQVESAIDWGKLQSSVTNCMLYGISVNLGKV